MLIPDALTINRSLQLFISTEAGYISFSAAHSGLQLDILLLENQHSLSRFIATKI
jgi:hypothetical protein